MADADIHTPRRTIPVAPDIYLRRGEYSVGRVFIFRCMGHNKGWILTPVNPLLAIMGSNIVSVLWLYFKQQKSHNVFYKKFL